MIAYLENGVKTPSLPILVDLANALHISVDALLVDSLDYSHITPHIILHFMSEYENEVQFYILVVFYFIFISLNL